MNLITILRFKDFHGMLNAGCYVYFKSIHFTCCRGIIGRGLYHEGLYDFIISKVRRVKKRHLLSIISCCCRRKDSFGLKLCCSWMRQGSLPSFFWNLTGLQNPILPSSIYFSSWWSFQNLKNVVLYSCEDGARWP